MSVKHGINLSLLMISLINLIIRSDKLIPSFKRAVYIAGDKENLSPITLLLQIVNVYHIDVSTSIGNLDETFVCFDLKSRKAKTKN